MPSLTIDAGNNALLHSGPLTLTGVQVGSGGTPGSLFVSRSLASLCWTGVNGTVYSARGVTPVADGRPDGTVFADAGGNLFFILSGQRYAVQSRASQVLTISLAYTLDSATYSNPDGTPIGGGTYVTGSLIAQLNGADYVVPAASKFSVTSFSINMQSYAPRPPKPPYYTWSLESGSGSAPTGLSGGFNPFTANGTLAAPLTVLRAADRLIVDFQYLGVATVGAQFTATGTLEPI
jgi:hypothetical protein